MDQDEEQRELVQPTTWNDERLLHVEPFLTEFAVRRSAPPPSRKRNPGSEYWNARITEEILKDPSSIYAFNAWMNFVIPTGHQDDGRNLLNKPSLPDRAAFAVFIDVYWLLYIGDATGAQRAFSKFKLSRSKYTIGEAPKNHNHARQSGSTQRPPGPQSNYVGNSPGFAGQSKKRGRGRPKKYPSVNALVKKESFDTDLTVDAPSASRAGIPGPAHASTHLSVSPQHTVLDEIVERPSVVPSYNGSQAGDVFSLQWTNNTTHNFQPPRPTSSLSPTKRKQSGKSRSNSPNAGSPSKKLRIRNTLHISESLEAISPSQGQLGEGSQTVCDRERDQDPEHERFDYLTKLETSLRKPPSFFPEEHLRVIKPPLPNGVRPVIWAESRQEVCESFSLFRSYQGGVYSVNGMVKGYLLSAFSSARDHIDHGGKLIISHGGGKSVIAKSKQGLAERDNRANQTDTDTSVKALLHNYEDNLPVVLLADDKYFMFPYDLGRHTYVVLGYYWITNAWAEKEVSRDRTVECVKYKFAFQWCENQGEPWWSCSGIDSPTSDLETKMKPSSLDDMPGILCSLPSPCEPCVPTSDTAVSVVTFPQDLVHPIVDCIGCSLCGKSFPQVYKQGWICLSPTCENFWVLPCHVDELTYLPSFLRLRATPVQLNSLPDLRPSPPVAHAKDGVITSTDFCKGWWCPDCGKLNCREKWECWECNNCQNRLEVTGGRVRSSKELWSQRRHDSFLHHKTPNDSGITVKLWQWTAPIGSGAALTFTMPNRCGFIHLILGNPIVNRTANNIFELYQEEAFKRPFFRRYPLQSHLLRGRMLTNYFSQNSGVPYKYIAGTGNTTPFEHAPQAVNEALQLIKDRARLAVGKSVDFNEVLSAAYMEKQKMSFHSDSEPGLGTVLSSLSLGSEALMHFRLRAKFKDVKRAKGHSQNELTIRLRHGDVLVMQGQDIQDKYEHTVVPTNFRIAATARFIDATGRLSQFPDDFQDDSSPHMESDFIPTYPINKYNNPHDTLAR